MAFQLKLLILITMHIGHCWCTHRSFIHFAVRVFPHIQLSAVVAQHDWTLRRHPKSMQGHSGLSMLSNGSSSVDAGSGNRTEAASCSWLGCVQGDLAKLNFPADIYPVDLLRSKHIEQLAAEQKAKAKWT